MDNHERSSAKLDKQMAALKLRHARAGTGDALNEVLRLYRPLLLKIANDKLDPQLKVKEAASDLVQKTLLEAYHGFAKFESSDADEFRAWLCRILLDNIKDANRFYRRAQKRQLGKERPLASDEVRALIGKLSLQRHPGPQSDSIRREELQRVLDAVDKLDRAYRQVILWKYQEGLDDEEIGRRCERSPDAARMLRRRALKQLKSILGTPTDE